MLTALELSPKERVLRGHKQGKVVEQGKHHAHGCHHGHYTKFSKDPLGHEDHLEEQGTKLEPIDQQAAQGRIPPSGLPPYTVLDRPPCHVHGSCSDRDAAHGKVADGHRCVDGDDVERRYTYEDHAPCPIHGLAESHEEPRKARYGDEGKKDSREEPEGPAGEAQGGGTEGANQELGQYRKRDREVRSCSPVGSATRSARMCGMLITIAIAFAFCADGVALVAGRL